MFSTWRDHQATITWRTSPHGTNSRVNITAPYSACRCIWETPAPPYVCQVSIGGNHHTARAHSSTIPCCYCMSLYSRNSRSPFPHCLTCFVKIYICTAVLEYTLTIHVFINTVSVTIIQNIIFHQPVPLIFYSLIFVYKCRYNFFKPIINYMYNS
jgi:hypothetical protein